MKLLKSTLYIILLTSWVSCVAASSLPTIDNARLQKVGIDDLQRSQAGYRHWTSDIIEVTNLDTKEIVYKPNEWDMRDPLVDMYLTLPPSNYLVKTRCIHSLDIIKDNVWLDELNIEVKGSEKMKLEVSFADNTCTTKINNAAYISKS